LFENSWKHMWIKLLKLALSSYNGPYPKHGGHVSNLKNIVLKKDQNLVQLTPKWIKVWSLGELIICVVPYFVCVLHHHFVNCHLPFKCRLKVAKCLCTPLWSWSFHVSLFLWWCSHVCSNWCCACLCSP